MLRELELSPAVVVGVEALRLFAKEEEGVAESVAAEEEEGTAPDADDAGAADDEDACVSGELASVGGGIPAWVRGDQGIAKRFVSASWVP